MSPFHLLCGKFSFPYQFFSFICRIAYCFVFPKFRLCSHRVILKTTKTFKPKYEFAVSEYGKYVDKFPLPLINVGRLSMELSPANVAYQFPMGRPFSALEIATLKGGGGVRNGKDRVSVLKTLLKRFFKWLVLESSANLWKKIFVLFSDFYNQPYTFKNKIKSKRRLIWRPRNGLWYGLHYGLHL